MRILFSKCCYIILDIRHESVSNSKPMGILSGFVKLVKHWSVCASCKTNHSNKVAKSKKNTNQMKGRMKCKTKAYRKCLVPG